MVEQGLRGRPETEDRPNRRGIAARLPLHRVDRMHTKGKSVIQIGSPEPEARREAYRGTRDPGYINYTVGKLEILKLRDDYLAKMGDFP